MRGDRPLINTQRREMGASAPCRVYLALLYGWVVKVMGSNLQMRRQSESHEGLGAGFAGRGTGKGGGPSWG